MLESKWVRTSAGTVVAKTAQRVFYQIDNFDNLPEPRRSHATEKEAQLIKRSGPRSTYASDLEQKVDVGSRIYVRYQCFSDGDLIIVGVTTTPPL